MISLYKQNTHIAARTIEFIADNEADVANLPTKKEEVNPGSSCIIAATGEVYILSPSYEWKKI